MVRIPTVAFDNTTPQIGTTGGGFNTLAAVGEGLSQVAGAVQFAEQRKKAEAEQKRVQAEKMQRAAVGREKREADAYIPRARTDFLLRHEQLAANSMEIQDPQERLEAYTQGFSDLEAAALKAAPNGTARARVQEESQKARLKFGTEFIRNHAKQTQSARVDGVVQADKNIAAAVRQGLDYGVASEALEANYSDLKGVTTPQKAKELHLEQQQNVKASYIDFLMEKEDFASIKELLSDGKFTKDLPVNIIDATRNKIKEQTLKNQNLLINDTPGFFERQARIDGREYDYMESIEAQKKRGISPVVASVIGKESAQILKDRMLKISSPNEMQMFVSEINQQYGKYSRNAFNDLKKAGLPREYSFISQLDPMQDAQEMALAFDVVNAGASVIKENAKSALSEDNQTISDFQEAFREEVSELSEVMTREGASSKVIGDMSYNQYMLSLAHVAKYKDADAAIEMAANLPLKRGSDGSGFKIADIDGTDARIPHALDDDDVEDGLDNLIDQRSIFVPSISESIKSLVGASVKDKSYWSLSPDGEGMILRNGDDYTPLLDDNMEVIQYSFKEILKAAK